MSFWLVFGGGAAVGAGIVIVIFTMLAIFSLARMSGDGAATEEESQRIQEEEIERLQQVSKKRAQIHAVVR